MLILTRSIGQKIVLGDQEIAVVVLGVNGGQVKIGIEAPDNMSVHREEIYWKIKREQLENAQSSHLVNDYINNPPKESIC